MTVRAIAIHSGKGVSDASSASYIIRYNKLSTPLILPASGTYSDDIAVTISGDSGTELRYTLDGSTPHSGSLKYFQSDIDLWGWSDRDRKSDSGKVGNENI